MVMIEILYLAVCGEIESDHVEEYRFDTGKLSREKLLVSNPLAIGAYGLLKANTMGRKKEIVHPGILRFCKAVKQRIESGRLTQKALAQSLGMSTAWLSQVKRGDIGRPDFEKLQKLGEWYIRQGPEAESLMRGAGLSQTLEHVM